MTRARWPTFRRYVGALITSSGKRGAYAFGAILLAALFEGLGLALLIPIIGLILAPGGSDAGNGRAQMLIHGAQAMLGDDRQRLLVTALGAFLLVMIVRGGVIFVRDRMLWQLQHCFIAEQRSRLVTQLAEANWSDLVTLDHARVTSQLSGEIARVSVATTMTFQIIVALAMLIVQGGLALLIAPAFGALILILLAAITLPALSRLDRIGTLGQHSTRGHAELLSAINQLLNGLKVALAQGMGRHFSREFDTLQARHLGIQREYSLGRARDQLIFGLVAALAMTLLVGIGVTLFGLSATIVATMIVIFSRIAGPVRSLQQAVPQLFFMLPAFESVTALGATLAAARAMPAEPQPLPTGPLAFRDVRYLHPPGGGVRHASFTLAAGECVGICGPSGGGKTTLLDLAAGLLMPQSGSIWVGDAPLDAPRLAAWQDRIAYATQEPFLFFGSVRHNICWGGSADPADLSAAIGLVGATALIEGLPDGIDTLVGERGASLSGGERQRLILARALLRKPALLILDESTSSLDAASEAAILAAFRRVTPRPAILFVTHRAESLALCDRVLTMDNGTIID
ncbi:ABC transporter ATP-binding protein [Sphingomonas sp. 28-63-12]|uniref:ATP-binding cassette domain-containing protein n=1 Tax=Sphingomonas sp. 28-63-12 TaxID=1970434 RepID=UPI000BCA0936|nr:MAG: hypothetical protein B7Y47_06090 [Sphingomonas sp. 28-63-12]